MSKLPPLNAVRAFEAAARHISFSKAAEELHVTRGAISRQVALLESWLNRPLFVRGAAQLTLTHAGSNFLTEASAALNRLSFAAEYLRNEETEVVIRLNAPPTFTMRWLMARMPTFLRRHPHIDLRVATYRPMDTIREEEFDVGIRGRWAPLEGVTSIPFIQENIIPVCHPDLLEEGLPLQVDDIANHTLITYSTESYTWPQWLAAMGRPTLAPARILRFDPMYFGLQAAQEGLGLVLLPTFIVVDDLISGKLCAPFGMQGVRRRHYYVSSQPTSHLFETIGIFSEYLIQEGSTTDRLIQDWSRESGFNTA
ncbi:MAG: hypothetical protein ABS43_23370 [Bordetella sp. SCN 67-23]|nr:LysR family transcriptional regulator [Burkholderiales bacterium]ODS70224.1 MAG: hypothetical protein ABS43_23370 [Bordetella sp. SCN 67-23]ODU66438.1 MAG: hypothetical protein ABT00_22215 [Bordetella sp. SCN 68-11]OJW92355.1 MAG: hypothetical protein BGO71_07645 [Burkholderiales bacterium 67-32]